MELHTQDLNQLSQEKRNWLFMILWRIYTTECSASEEEHNDLMRAMSWVRYSDRTKLAEMAGYLPEDFYGSKPADLNFEESYLMWVNAIQIVTEKGTVNLSTKMLIEKVGKILGFHKEALPEAMKLASQMAFVKTEIEKLRHSLRPYYQRRTDDQPAKAKVKA
ncbi:MAG: hypothetical protein QNL04_05980 [SAR324 cluster bacterium]|nr:hypothetical protein [SAR324 cluster bacterium]